MKWASSCLSVLCSYERLLQGLWSSNTNSGCIFIGSGPVSSTQHTYTLASRMQARNALTHTTFLLWYAQAKPYSSPLLSSSFIIVLPCGISSVFVLSHYITFSPLAFKHRFYSTIWDSFFFFFLMILIIPILYWGVLLPLLKLDNKKQWTLPRESTSQNPFDQCLKDTCWDLLTTMFTLWLRSK